MKITLKDTSTLIQDAKGTSDGIDDRLENFFRTYGSKWFTHLRWGDRRLFRPHHVESSFRQLSCR